MLAHLVHHTDDLQRPDAPLIALVTESALTVGQAGVELSFRSHPPTRRVAFRSLPAAARNGAGSVPRRRGVGTAFALEKAVLLSLPDARTAARAWDLAIECKRRCEADVQRAHDSFSMQLCRSSRQTLLLYWWMFCQRRLRLALFCGPSRILCQLLQVGVVPTICRAAFGRFRSATAPKRWRRGVCCGA